MAKRKKRALVHKKAPWQRTKARARGRSAAKAAKRASKTGAKKVAKRVAAAAKTKKRASKIRAMRAATKAIPRPTEPSIQPAEALDEAVIVDMIEEPLPGVVVVTEFETMRTRLETAASQGDAGEIFAAAEEEEEEE